jgi:arylsulfatase A-like enzyme
MTIPFLSLLRFAYYRWTSVFSRTDLSSSARWRPGLCLGATLCLWLAGCSSGEPSKPEIPEPPRGVLLIVVDTLRADYVGPSESRESLTPSLDALSEDALVFENGMAASSWTRPSLASIFTGQYPTTVDVLTKEDVLESSLVTLAESLSAAGLRSFAVSTNGNAGESLGFAQGFEEFIWRLPKVGYPGDFPVVPANEVTKAGLELVDSLRAEEPFFLFLHYIDPHDPYLPHPELMSGPEPEGRFDGSRRDLTLVDKSRDRTPLDIERLRWLYSGEVKFCDLWLGKLFDGLRERGLLDDMLVIVTSDHGEGLFDHGKRAHGTDLHDEQLHVPFIVRFPRDGAPDPARVRSFASHVDVLPTIFGAYGLEQPEFSQGRDLGLAARRGTLETDGVYSYSEMNFTGLDSESISDGTEKLIRNRAYDGDKADPFEYVVRKKDTLQTVSRMHYGRLDHTRQILQLNPEIGPKEGTVAERLAKVVLEPDSVLKMPAQRLPRDGLLKQFYQLDTDPGEQSNLSHTDRGRTTRLHELLKHYAAENTSRSIESENIQLQDLDPETIAELRALGYLGGDS